ncbi:AAA family ATPase, partial [Desulfocurvibacter africanus]
MLELLRIRNLALIDDLELEFAPGLNALTGETGAGKSFILRAVNFLTGDKLTPDMVRAGRDKAMVEALFVVEGVECVIRRELAADTGRSRLYVNDRLSSLETVESLKAGLVLHTSQHGQQKLLSPAYQSRMLDAFLPDKS